MVALNETVSEFEKSKALRQSLQEAQKVNRSGRVFLGTLLAISALGLWLVPVADGDTGMRLIKILVSLVLLGLGAMFISSIDEIEALPEIQIDTQNRELRIMQLDKSCTIRRIRPLPSAVFLNRAVSRGWVAEGSGPPMKCALIEMEHTCRYMSMSLSRVRTCPTRKPKV